MRLETQQVRSTCVFQAENSCPHVENDVGAQHHALVQGDQRMVNRSSTVTTPEILVILATMSRWVASSATAPRKVMAPRLVVKATSPVLARSLSRTLRIAWSVERERDGSGAGGCR